MVQGYRVLYLRPVDKNSTAGSRDSRRNLGVFRPGPYEGDVLQLVVRSYIPGQYGHSLYVTKSGRTWDDILICCHSYDRLDEP